MYGSWPGIGCDNEPAKKLCYTKMCGKKVDFTNIYFPKIKVVFFFYAKKFYGR